MTNLRERFQEKSFQDLLTSNSLRDPRSVPSRPRFLPTIFEQLNKAFLTESGLFSPNIIAQVMQSICNWQIGVSYQTNIV